MTAVLFKFHTPDGAPVVGAPFTVTLRKPTFDELHDSGILLPGDVQGITDAKGECTLNLAPGYGIYYLVMATPTVEEAPDGCMSGLRYKFLVPISNEIVRVEDLIVTNPTWSRPWDEQALAIIIDAKTSANESAIIAVQSADRAQALADSIVGDAARAEAARAAAEISETNARTSAYQAGVSAEGSRQFMEGAATSAGQAASSASAAATSRNQAVAARDAAQTSETNAKASEGKAKTSETAAAGSATSASGSASTAAGAAGAATTKAAEASASATAAAGSAVTAKTEADRVLSYQKVVSQVDFTAGRLVTVPYMGLGARANATWQGTTLNPDTFQTGGCLIGQFTIQGQNLTGFLVTLPGSNDTVCGQQFTDIITNSYFTRTLSQSIWGAWVRHTGVHTVVGYDINAVASFIGSTDRFFSSPETQGTLPFQYGWVRFMAMANNNYKQIAYEAVDVTSAGSHMATRTFYGGVWGPWVKALNVGDFGFGGNNLFSGNIDTIVSAAPNGASFFKLTAQASGPLPPASTTHEGNTLHVDKWDGNNATVIYRSRGAMFIRGVLDGNWTTAGWNLVYNAGNILNSLDSARYGIMDTQVISNFRVVRFYNGFMVASASGSNIQLASNEAKAVGVNLPVSFPDYGKCSVSCQLIATANWDHYGAIQKYMTSPTAANLIVRNGATAQIIGMQNLTVSGFWK